MADSCSECSSSGLVELTDDDSGCEGSARCCFTDSFDGDDCVLVDGDDCVLVADDARTSWRIAQRRYNLGEHAKPARCRTVSVASVDTIVEAVEAAEAAEAAAELDGRGEGDGVECDELDSSWESVDSAKAAEKQGEASSPRTAHMELLLSSDWQYADV